MKVQVKVVREGAIIPKYQTEGSAGLDLHACITEPVDINPGETKMIPTGLSVYQGDPSMMMHLMPRSGLSVKSGIVLANLVGLVDSDYQGELMIAAWNRKQNGGTVTINPGDRIAQMVFLPVLKPEFELVGEFTEATERGAGGFGSTGTAAEA